MTKQKVAIIGAGFSGLTLAWALTNKNISVEIFETSERTGGMLGSKFDGVLVETAANALLASESVERILSDIGVKPVAAGYSSKKRWIFRERPQRLPLNLFEFFGAASNIILQKLSAKMKPLKNETLAGFATRISSKKLNDYFISPAFQGVYGTTSDNLSASLIFNSAFNSNLKLKKGKFRGSISADRGMQSIINGLTDFLQSRGVVIHRKTQSTVAELQKSFSTVVVATSLSIAAVLLQEQAKKTAEKLKQIPTLPLTSVTVKFVAKKKIEGFGCLFPKNENFNSLGVLFNSDIFSGRGKNSETWILPFTDKSDEEILSAVQSDRHRITATDDKPEMSFIKRWPQALPLYGFELEKLLSEGDFLNGVFKGVRLTETEKPLYLTGNYLGVIGLSKILDYNLRLAIRIEKELT